MELFCLRIDPDVINCAENEKISFRMEMLNAGEITLRAQTLEDIGI
jgi:hypothetical protein